VARITHLGIQDNTLFTGYVGGSLQQALLAAAECFVLPSHGEAQSMALLEAIAAGLPAVYSTACCFPELAECGGGWEVPAEQHALAEQLCAVFSQNSAALQQAGSAARRYGRAHHTLERVAEQLLAMYEAAATGSH
jgi:glycosyltransferase involved in cell wall biosynthesis